METSSYEAFVERFATMCRADSRVAAAFVGGSRGAGNADEYADLDLYLILHDDTYDDFFAQRHIFASELGEAVFAEDFHDFGFDILLFIYADGIEGELVLARASGFEHIVNGTFKTLVDRGGVLPSHAFPAMRNPDDAEQRDQLRWLIQWFWRDLSQMSRCMQRDRLWSAYSHLEMMRQTCVRLARLKHDWTATLDGLYKLEDAADLEDLQSLQRSLCPLDRVSIIDSASALIELYERISPPLAVAHGVVYPLQLRNTVRHRFESATRMRV